MRGLEAGGMRKLHVCIVPMSAVAPPFSIGPQPLFIHTPCSRLPSADMLWVLQVDAIIEFERQMAPFLGALNTVGVWTVCVKV